MNPRHASRGSTRRIRHSIRILRILKNFAFVSAFAFASAFGSVAATYVAGTVGIVEDENPAAATCVAGRGSRCSSDVCRR